LEAYFLKERIGKPLEASHQHKIAEGLGYGIVWILPEENQIKVYHPKEDELQKLYVGLVLVTKGHCEPLADVRGRPRGLLDMDEINYLAGSLQYTILISKDFPTAGGDGDDAEDGGTTTPVLDSTPKLSILPSPIGFAHTTQLSDCCIRWKRTYDQIRRINRLSKATEHNEQQLANCSSEITKLDKDTRTVLAQINVIKQDLATAGTLPISLSKKPEEFAADFARKQRYLAYHARELNALDAARLRRSIILDRCLVLRGILENQTNIIHKQIMHSVRRDHANTNKVFEIPGASYETPGGSKLSPHSEPMVPFTVEGEENIRYKSPGIPLRLPRQRVQIADELKKL
jgi:hypothetical protein